MKRQVPAVSVVLLVVLAGCGGFSGTDTATPTGSVGSTTPTASTAGTAPPTETPTATPSAGDPPGSVTVEGGELPFDAAAVYERVVEMHGLSMSEAPPVTVHVAPPPAASLTVGPFEELLGIVPSDLDPGNVGRAEGTDVWINPEQTTDPSRLERILAHEFTHVIQFERNAYRRISEAFEGGPGTTGNEQLLALAIVEGSARYVETRYAGRYLGGAGELPSWSDVRGNRSQYDAYSRLYYHFGARYVAGRVDGADELGTVYDDPPRTMEQLVHGYAPDEEPPRELDVGVNASGSWYVADGTQRTRGELFVRFVLEGELGLDRAAEAAAGWGNDELVPVRNADPGQERGYAWALRWDDPAEADEFAAAMADFLDAHAGTATDGVWRTDDGDAFRLVRASDEMVVLLAGAPAFVENASVNGQDGEVTVTVEA